MASSGQSVDELIAQLVGMGFELQDAQQAIQAGKLSVTDAIEWIVGGKPPVHSASSGPGVLKLGKKKDESNSGVPIGSNPFSNPQPLAQASSSETTSPERLENPYQDEGVVSRVRMNEEQRKVKEKFEQKQREEARRSAKEQRISAKKDREAILRQIQEDREMQKIRRQGQTSTASGQTVGTAASTSSSVTTEDRPPPEKKKDDTALLQIRLPDGRALREKFASESTLHDVSNFVADTVKNIGNVVLIQPFPRQEFGPEHMAMSLRELNLAPSGSLVLKKSEASQNEPPRQPDPPAASSILQSDFGGPIADASDEDVPTAPLVPQPQQPTLPFVHDVLGTHQWGTGHSMMNAQQASEAGTEDEHQPPVQAMEEEDSDSDQEEAGAVGGIPPAAGGGFGWGNFGPGNQYQDDNDEHFMGEGHILAGQVLNPENMPHHQQSPAQLAAEAARQRYAQPAAPIDQAGQQAQVPVIYHSVHPLSQLLIQHICGRICDSRHPLTGLQGLPADIAIKVVEHLIREKLLKPKTLHPFVSCRLRKLVLDCYPYTTNELLTALRLHVNISHLSLGSCSLITDRGLQPLIALKRLKHLSLSGCRQLTNNCLPIVAEFHQLVSLNLENTGVTDTGVMEYAQTSPENLQHLNLSKTQVTHNILPSLQAIQNLKSLSLELTQVTGLSGIQNLSGLESLNLCGTPIVTDALLCLSVDKHPKLIAINIANTPNVHGDLALEYLHNSGLKLEAIQLPSRLSTTDAGIAHISAMKLQTLDFTNYIQISDVAMQYVGQIETLKKLRLSNTKVSDAGLVFLEGLKALEELYIDRVPTVTDAGLAVIRGFSRLQELSLSETGIGNTLLKSLFLNECLLLSKLNLSKTEISTRGAVCLKLPHLTLLNLDGTRVRAEVEETLRSNCPELSRVSLIGINPVSAVDEETDHW